MRERWASRFASILLLCGAAFLAAPRPAAAPVEITFWTMENVRGSLIEEIRIFEEENPGVRVRVMGVPWGTGLAMLYQAAAARTGPDVVQVGSTWVPLLSRLGFLPDASAWVERLGGRGVFSDDALRLAGADDRPGLYAVPWVREFRFLVYRKDALEAAGLRPAEIGTLEGFAAACRRVHGFGDQKGETHPALLSGYLFDPTAQFWFFGTDALDTSTFDGLWDEPKARAALRFWMDLQDSYAEFRHRPPPGAAVFNFHGPWEITSMDTAVLGVAPFPAGPGGAFAFSGGSLLAVPRYAERPEAARRLVEFLVSRGSQRRYAAALGNLPVRRDLADEAAARHSFYADLRAQAERPGYLRTPPRRAEATLVAEILNRQGMYLHRYAAAAGDAEAARTRFLGVARREAQTAVFNLRETGP